MKKKILFINSSNFGSTGNIVKTLGNQLSNSYDFYYSYPKTRSNLKNLSTNTILIGDILFRNIGIFISKIFGLHNLLSIFSTLSYIKKIRKIKPDLVHIHNLHNGYINIVLLFKFLQSSKIKIIWTLHDTFSFTGKCVHFSSANCNKWITECNNCPLLRNYPDSLVDNSNFLFKIKKKLFTKFNKTDIVFITPSNWLSDQVKLSFLKEYKVSVIPNGIDTNIFKISKHYFESFKRLTQFKHVILGVANNWNDRKGLKIFSDLSKLIPNNQVVVLVGSIPNNFRIMNPNIIFIERTCKIFVIVPPTNRIHRKLFIDFANALNHKVEFIKGIKKKVSPKYSEALNYSVNHPLNTDYNINIERIQKTVSQGKKYEKRY